MYPTRMIDGIEIIHIDGPNAATVSANNCENRNTEGIGPEEMAGVYMEWTKEGPCPLKVCREAHKFIRGLESEVAKCAKQSLATEAFVLFRVHPQLQSPTMKVHDNSGVTLRYRIRMRVSTLPHLSYDQWARIGVDPEKAGMGDAL